MRRVLTFIIASGSVLTACGAGNSATIQCAGDRTPLDGVCVSPQVADYVACVRAQGAKLGEDRSKKLSMEAGYAGAHAAVASDVGEKLQKEYSTSDNNALEIIRACGAMRGSEEDVCSKAGATLVSCGYETDPGWLPNCQAQAPYRACLAQHQGDCNALSACGFDDIGRRFCGGAALGQGNAGCEATGNCTHACGGDAKCKCDCFAAMASSASLAVGLQGQCFQLHCGSCLSQGAAACDACFAQHCQAGFDRACKGH
ncbi:MAG TPA: hypothetical protein VGG39_06135 [Polyangiaceae bacterium]|jgi:hypothetical protein